MKQTNNLRRRDDKYGTTYAAQCFLDEKTSDFILLEKIQLELDQNAHKLKICDRAYIFWHNVEKFNSFLEYLPTYDVQPRV